MSSVRSNLFVAREDVITDIIVNVLSKVTHNYHCERSKAILP